jgi:hypothetical protein
MEESMKEDRREKMFFLGLGARSCRRLAVVGLAVLLALFMTPIVGLDMDQSSAWASGDSGHAGQGGKVVTSSGHKGEQGKGQAAGQGGQGGAKSVSSILSDDGEDGDDDSDRPDWAKGNREENPHISGGMGKPSAAGTNKGDTYGDLWIILRDPVSGLPILDENGYVQPLITLEDGTVVAIQLTEDGELLPEYADAVSEVEFGRLSVGRSPAKVTDHALDEALAKLVAGEIVTLDLAGRLVVDGATIDSPLENLALYIALMTDDPALNPVADKIDMVDKLTLAANLLAAAADKTGSINIDVVAYENIVLGIAAMTPEDFVDYSSFDYNRTETYPGTISYYVQQADGTVVLVTDTILQAVFDGETYTSADGAGIVDFAQAADDALQMIEFIHTTIHVE